MEDTCKTCINNDDGLCDRKGILVEDEDSCEHHWPAGKKVKIKKHEKKLDITPELAIAAYNTLIQFCRSQPASEDGTCSSCILYQHCPGASDLLPEEWKEVHYPCALTLLWWQQSAVTYGAGRTVIYNIKTNGR